MGTSPERPEGKTGCPPTPTPEPWPAAGKEDRLLKKTVGKGEGEQGFSWAEIRGDNGESV